MSLHRVFANMSIGSRQSPAHEQLNSSQECLLPPATQRVSSADSHLSSYDNIHSLPECRAIISKSLARATSFTRQVAGIFTPRRTKKPAPVTPEHQAVLNQITRIEAELSLGRELQAATKYRQQLEDAWDTQSRTPSERDDDLYDLLQAAKHTEDIYDRLIDLLKIYTKPQMCLPGTRGAELIRQKLEHLHKLESLHCDMAHCVSMKERLQWAMVCPKYSGMSATRAIKRMGELTRWSYEVANEMMDTRSKISRVEDLIEQLGKKN